MEFTIELADPAYTIQEPIPITFRLTNRARDRAIPLDYKTTDVVTLVLYDEEGDVLARVDGYTKAIRFGQPPRRKPQASLETAMLEDGQTMEWVEDALRYVDIREPGTYALRAIFQFEPEDLILETQPVSFEVTPNRPQWMDVVRDQVAMDMAYLVQHHRNGSSAPALFHIMRGNEPTSFWKSASVDVPEGATPMVSEADFTTQDSFDHDFFRWLVWIQDGQLQLTSVNDAEPLGEVYSHPFPQEGARLVGRPVQHHDRGMTALVLHSNGNSYALQRHAFDAQGQHLQASTLASLAGEPVPLASGADWQGGGYIVVGTARRLPLQGISYDTAGGHPVQTLLSVQDLVRAGETEASYEDLRLLDVEVDAKAFAAGREAVLAVLQRQNQILLVRIPIEQGRFLTEQRSVQDVVLQGVGMQDGTIRAAHVVQTRRAGLHAIVVTEAGDVWYLRPGHPPERVLQLPVDAASLPKLVRTGGDAVYLFFPTEQAGIAHQRLFQLPSR